MQFYVLMTLIAIGGGMGCIVGCRMHAKRTGAAKPRVSTLLPHIIGSAVFACVAGAFLTHVVISAEITAIAKRAVTEGRNLTLEEKSQVHELSKWWIGSTL